MTVHGEKLRASLGGIFLFLSIIVTLVAGVAVGEWRAREVDDFLREELLRRAHVLAETIDIRDVRLLSGRERDKGTPQYEIFKNYFRSIIRAFPESRFLSLVGRRYDGTIFFYVDSEPPGSEYESSPGDVYEEVNPAFQEVFGKGKSAVLGPFTNRWGSWVSAWIPMMDPGLAMFTVALILDFSGDEWESQLNRARLLPVLTSLLLAALLISGRILLKRRARTSERERLRSRYLAFAVTMLFGIVLTSSLAWIAHDRERRSHAHAFSIIAEARSVSMNNTLHVLRRFALEGIARLFESSRSMEYPAFRTYSQHLSGTSEIEAIMWSPRVSADEREGYQSVVREEWRGPVAIRERSPSSGMFVSAGKRPRYYPVLFRSPMTGVEFPVGEDLLSNPALRGAIEVAERTKRSAAALVRLEWGLKNRFGLWVCRPLCSSAIGSPLLGIVSALFPIEALLHGVVEGSDDVTVERLDALFPEEPLLSLFLRGEAAGESTFRFVRPLFLFDSVFSALLHPGPAFLKYHELRAGWFVLVSGLATTLALSFFIAFSANRRETLERLVEKRTAELRESESWHRMAGYIYRSLSEGIVVTDPEGYILDGNAALEQLTGYSLDEIRGKRPGMFSAQRKQGEDSLRFWEYLRGNGTWQGETWNRRKNGEAYPVWLTVNAVMDEDGKVTHYAGVLTHIGDIKSEQQRLSHLAYFDSLTGLPNRLLLADRLEMALARSRRESTFVAVLFLDLDGFKEINDTYGHETGDVLLASLARRLLGAVREQDTVARLGGDEFVLVFDGLEHPDRANVLRARVEELFNEPFVVGQHTLPCNASAGLSIHSPEEGRNAQEMIADADARMYDEKVRKKTRKALPREQA